MIIAFFGHSDFIPNDKIRDDIFEILNGVAGDSAVEFFLGGYGAFDLFAFRCCLDYKKTHDKARLILVTPYLTLSRNLLSIANECDEVLYPPLESVTPRFAISARNKWIAESADIIISYVNHSWGGAYEACRHCAAKGKRLVNLGSFDFFIG